MYPLTIPVLCIAFAGFTGISAQTTTISLYIPGADTQPLVGSIVASDATATTYVLECAPGTDASDCGFDGPFTLTEGPSTAVYTLSADAFTGYEDCSLAGTASAVCIESNGGSSANFPGISTETYSATDFTYMPVTITAGAVASGSVILSSKSAGVASTTNARSASTDSSSTTAATGPTLKSSGTSTSTSAGAATQTTSSKASTSTAGMPSVSGNVNWAVGGAAVVLALMV